MPAVGQKIALALQLETGATDQFVRAKVTNDAGVAVGASPFSLPHVVGGLYRLDTVTMPDTDFVLAQYEVFTDSGFTTPSATYGKALDRFETFDNTDGSAQLEALIETDFELTADIEF